MTSDAIIALSGVAEPWIVVAVGAGLLVLAARAVLDRNRRSDARETLDAGIEGRTEGLLLALIVLIGFGARAIGWDDALTPAFWFSQVPTLHVGRMLQTGSLWSTWTALFHTTQVGWAHESVLLLPLLAGLQTWLGPRFGVPLLAGCVVGTASIVLAWALGRRMRSQAFGLLFAAFVACSPLQLTWARLGGYYIAGPAYLLLALLVGYVAGGRASVLLAGLAGIVAWGSLYQYYAARVAIPLTALAMLAGAPRWTSVRRRVLLVVVWMVAFAAVGFTLAPGKVRETLWPAYGSYAGNRGERSLAEFVSQNLPGFLEQAPETPRAYFLNRRTETPTPGYAPGVQQGGLCLLPTALLGVVGLLSIGRRLRSQWLWLVVAAAGLALPIVSITTARRLLVFDIAWAAFAAHGLLALVDGLRVAWTRRGRAAIAAIAVSLVAAWSFTAVFALSAALPASRTPIPFGESGFGDGTTCKRCLAAAKEWQRDVAAGGFVVLFDNDQGRENRTSPGGLPVYGKIAALAAGRPGWFVEGYALMGGYDGEAPTPGPLFDPGKRDFATELVDRIERAAPSRIVWHFERPTLWEQWLARRLSEVGGTLASFPTALSTTPGLQVVTPWDQRDRAFALLRDLAAGYWPTVDSPCVTLTRRAEFSMAGPVLLLAAAPGAGTSSPPEWLGASWAELRLGSRRFEHPTTIGAAVPPTPTEALEVFGEFGQRTAIDRETGVHAPISDRPTRLHGLNCAVHVDGHWWSVDPLAGAVTSSHPQSSAVPAGQWIGAARGGGDELVLVSADQSILVFDPKTAQVVRQFPARVSPSVRVGTDECSQVAAGDGWIATVNLRTGVASFYDRAGQAFGTTRIDPARLAGDTLTAFAGAGYFLGTGSTSGVVRTFQVAIDPLCGSPPDELAR